MGLLGLLFLYTFLFVCVFALFLFIVIGVNVQKSKKDVKKIIYSCVGFIGCVLFIVYFILTIKYDTPKLVKDFEFNIVAMENKTVYLQSRHTVDDDDRFYFMRDYGDNIQIGYIPQDDSCLIEDDSNPRIEVYKGKYKTFLGNCMQFDLLENIHYKIYIPKNSIKQDFNFDLGK